MTNITELSTAQLLAVYNHYADKPVARFATPAIGRTRVAKLLTTIDAPECKAIAAVLAPVKAPAAKPAKAAKAVKPAKPVETAPKAPGGAKATILAMIAAKGGTTERDVAKALGWPRAGGTISRAIAAASFTVRKEKGEDGRTVYSRA